MSRDNEELMELLMRLQWLVSRYFHRNLRERGSRNVPYSGQGRVLKLLKMKPEIPQKELSEILGMRPQSIGELLSKLEKKGYITRTPSPEDKRVIIVHLTEAGANADDGANGGTNGGDIFDCLSGEEQDILKGYLNRIISSIENQCGEEYTGQRRRRRGFADFSPNPDGGPEDIRFDGMLPRDRFFRN